MRIKKFQLKTFEYSNLKQMSFGKLEGEKDDSLTKKSIVVTSSITDLLDGTYNYVLSSKGGGKSAIFSAFKNKMFNNELFDYNKYDFVFIDESFGYNDDYLNPDKFKNEIDKSKYTLSWAFYIAYKIVTHILESHKGIHAYTTFKEKISQYGDLKSDFKLYNIFDYIEHLKLSLQFTFNGQKIEISPNVNVGQKKRDIRINELFAIINEFYSNINKSIIILIDRIDTFVTQEKYEIQRNYIRGIINTIEEIDHLTFVKPMLFLRTDLLKSIDVGFEYDKARARTIHLKWTETEILWFLSNRFLSNKFIRDNYKKYINIFASIEFNRNNKTNPIITFFNNIFGKPLKPYDLSNDLGYRVFSRFLLLFLPKEITHKNGNDRFIPTNTFKWLFTHFKDKNDYINPRSLIHFFNLLLKNQYECYQNDPQLVERCTQTHSGDQPTLNVFMSEIFQKTYSQCQNEELTIIYLMLSGKDRRIFKQINDKAFKKGYFDFSDIRIKGLDGYDVNDLFRLLKHLQVLGFCKPDLNSKNTKYTIPILYQKQLDLDN